MAKKGQKYKQCTAEEKYKIIQNQFPSLLLLAKNMQLKTKMIFTGIKRNWGHYNFIIILTIIQINLSHKLPFHKPTGIRLKYFVTQLLTESFE